MGSEILALVMGLRHSKLACRSVTSAASRATKNAAKGAMSSLQYLHGRHDALVYMYEAVKGCAFAEKKQISVHNPIINDNKAQ